MANISTNIGDYYVTVSVTNGVIDPRTQWCYLDGWQEDGTFMSAEELRDAFPDYQVLDW